MTGASHISDMPSREQAAAMLAQAESRRREAAHFSPAMVVFTVICTSSGLGILLINFTQGQQRLAGMIAWLAYVLVGSFMPFVVRHGAGFRGFGKRWGVLMGVWGAMWAAAVAVTTAVGNGTNANLQIVVPVVCSVAFLVLMVVAVAAEASRVRHERRALAPTVSSSLT